MLCSCAEQDVRKQLGAASSSGPTGSSGGMPDNLLREYEDIYEDERTAVQEKLNGMADVVLSWLETEATNPFVGGDVLDVRDHNTYGRKLAALNKMCTCEGKDAEKDNCFLHCSNPNITDLIYEVSLAAFEVFDDQWTCFSNLALDTFSAGHPDAEQGLLALISTGFRQ